MTKRRQTQIRNWKIYRLRGLYGGYGLLDADLREKAQVLVDIQLERHGAESETGRREKRDVDYERQFGVEE